ncbi:Protein saal1 [Orchesella cincta]|uniref:Protein saal1 n=1 Tax=Orchesella cincta TaxID=48709 RepID=A0A1D2MU17_ORCCI|nr:Protein saal1 [Orchesella cincta]
MNYEDSSSDDVPYLPPDQFKTYEQRVSGQFSQNSASDQNQNPVQSSQSDQRRGRSHFTDDELRELDLPIGAQSHHVGAISSIPRPSSPSHTETGWSTVDLSQPTPSNLDNNMRFHYAREPSLQSSKISWGRRTLGILLIMIPAVLFSVAVHFVDWSMSDFQLYSASFFIFQGIFWPSFGMLLIDLFCTSKTHADSSSDPPKRSNPVGNGNKQIPKWLLTIYVVIHGNLTAATIIFQLLSIQRLNISVSLALSFGFDVVVILIQYISTKRRCSLELLLLSIVSYCGYGVVAIPAFISSDHTTRNDTAVGVGASVGVLLLSIPATFLLSHIRKHQVGDSIVGTTTAFFGIIQSLITKEIIGSALNLRLESRSVGWAAGLISVVFLGVIFLFLEARLSALIWQRDDDKPRNFSSVTRTRLAVFMLSCLWEVARQGFRDSAPEPFDILGGFLVMLSFLLSAGFQAWFNSSDGLNTADANTGSSSPRGTESRHKFFAFLPWLFAQRS